MAVMNGPAADNGAIDCHHAPLVRRIGQHLRLNAQFSGFESVGLGHGVFTPVQAIQNKLAEPREADFTGHRVAEHAILIHQIDHILFIVCQINVFADFDVTLSA